jgi:hypothetical protein
MKNYWSKTIVVFHASLILIALGAQAQDDGQPAGPYLDTCKNVAWDPTAGILKATCATSPYDLPDPVASLDYKTLCAKGSKVEARGMFLICSSYSDLLPKGHYNETCPTVSWDPTAGRLVAFCNDWATTLKYKDLCTPGSEITLVNGHLACDSFIATLPKGPYLEICTNLDWNPATAVLQAFCPSTIMPQYPRLLNYGASCKEGSEVDNLPVSGMLACATYEDSFPKGSYTKTCGMIEWDSAAGTLKAFCRGSKVVFTILKYSADCKPGATVSNAGGALACDT